VDLAVAQNAAPLKLYRGAGGKPGLRVRLVGRADNPGAVGAAIRLRYNDGEGPVRVLRAGAGYWSADGLVQILGFRAEPRAVWVRWPSGRSQEVPLTPGQREVIIQERE
jgi:hypothetical protein